MKGYIDLSGSWEFCLDKDMKGGSVVFDDTMMLPGTTSDQKKGEYNENRETGFLTDTYKFEGWAWFRKKVNFDRLGCSVVKLFLERTRITTLFIDEEEIGTQESLCTPHVYDLSRFAGTGEHMVTIRVSNVGYKTGGGHLTSADTQTNWNGITGRIELIGYGEAYCENVMRYTDIHKKTVRITADVRGREQGRFSVSAVSFNSAKKHIPQAQEFEYHDGRIDVLYHMGDDCLLWSEHDPALYRLTITIGDDSCEHIIGMREFSTREGKFTINGKTTFLRGKHDGMIFPKTSYAPCTVDEWLRVMSISKSFGMNHYRFHTCCPPEAAFIAADMLGIYMEPQLPFWGTIAAPEEEGFNKEEQEFLIQEGFAILKTFGDHPSFCMMSMGNELWGSPERINDIMGGFKSFDRRHLYTQGSNNFQWFPNVVENDDFFVGVRLAKDRLIRGSYAMCDAPQGHIQTERPSADHCYDSFIRPEKKAASTEVSEDGTVQIQFGTTMKTVKASEADADFIPEIPIVTHEIGQYETYPDFDEIEKYTGSLKARNFEVFKERLEAKGLGQLAKDYFYCSGMLARACYKEEMEAVLRSKLLAGFQILDIQDFSGQGTALVGMLDAFMDNKGIITAGEWREFCNDTVVLALFDKYTYTENEQFSAKVRIVDFSDRDLTDRTLSWRACDGSGQVISAGCMDIPQGENYIETGTITFDMPKTKAVKVITLSLKIEGTEITNTYELELLPMVELPDKWEDLVFTKLGDEAKKLLEQGRKVLITPELSDKERFIEATYCQDFWCFPMFASISRMMNKPEPIGTMGLLVDNKHPALAEFGTRKYTTPVWYDVIKSSECEKLESSKDKSVIVRMIDNFERNEDLAILYEYSCGAGKVVVLNSDIDKLTCSPEGRLFLRSVLDYVRN